MNRRLKAATMKKYSCHTPHHLKEHLYTFLMAHNSAKRLKLLKGRRPYETSADAGQTSQNALALIGAITAWN
jgi:hypothetical protein